jgi:hypothetical protein
MSTALAAGQALQNHQMHDTIRLPTIRSSGNSLCARVLAAIVVACLSPLLRADIAKVPAPAGGEASPRQLVPVPSPTPWITIAKETSVVTGPVGPNGYVDYLAALDKAIGDGVTIDNNAAVLLVKAIELWSLSGADKLEFFRRLGIKPPPPAVGRFKDASELPAERGGPSENGIVSSVSWSLHSTLVATTKDSGECAFDNIAGLCQHQNAMRPAVPESSEVTLLESGRAVRMW